MSELSSTISLCMKAGKLALGFDATVDAAHSGKAKLILLTTDTAARTIKEIQFQCGARVEIIEIPMTQAEVGRAIPKRVGVITLLDAGLARKIKGIVGRMKGVQ